MEKQLSRYPPALHRFHAGYIKIPSTECWEWKCVDTRGYGKFTVDGKTVLVHRFSYELHHGAPPEDRSVCHSCDNPRCVNPKHLFLGTHQDNMDDRGSKGRTANGSSNGMSKLTEDDVVDIRARLEQGETGTSIGILYNVTRHCIYAIKSGKSWRGGDH